MELKNIADLPTVCVIIPVYNCAKWLPRCLNSVIGQTYARLEILVIDDGSTDDSGSIAEDFASRDPRMRLFRQENAGVAAARNRALSLTSSPLLMFLDSDDWLVETAVEKSLQMLLRENCDLVFFGMTHTSLSGKPVLVRNYYPKQKMFKKGEVLTEYLKGKIPVSLPGQLFRRELFSGIEFPVGRFFEDISVIHKIFANAGKAAYIPEQLYMRMHRPGSLSKTMLSCKREKDNLQAFQDCLAFILGRKHPSERYARVHVLRSALAVLTLNVMLPCLSPEEEKEVYALIRENGSVASSLPKRYRRLYDSALNKKVYLRFDGVRRFIQQAFKRYASAIRLRLAKA